MARAKTEQFAEPVDALAALPESLFACRDRRHWWDIQGYYHANGHVRRKLSCASCGTVRTDLWKPNARRIRNRYQYTEGYLLPKLRMPVKPQDVREVALSRVKVYASEESMTAALFRRNN